MGPSIAATPLVKIDHGSHQEAIPKEVRSSFLPGV